MRPKQKVRGTHISWEEFRAEYNRLKAFRSDDAKESAEVRLDICEAWLML